MKVAFPIVMQSHDGRIAAGIAADERQLVSHSVIVNPGLE
jgi:hypothetical protein